MHIVPAVRCSSGKIKFSFSFVAKSCGKIHTGKTNSFQSADQAYFVLLT